MESRKIVDAAHLRVIAHPTRLRLLGLLRERGPQTAAGLAEHIDEAPGTLSYHLTKLGEAGFIEEDVRPGGDRRQRWWKASQDETSWEDSEIADDPEKMSAALDFVRAVGLYHANQYETYFAGIPNLSREWVDASTYGDRTLNLTAPQLAQLSAELDGVVQKWRDVSSQHTDDGGSEQVIVVVQAYRRPA